MTNEAYFKCKTCRYCNHKGDLWACVLEVRSTEPESSCDRYRPGCCENCSMYSGGICKRDGEERYELDVCSDYDPSGSI